MSVVVYPAATVALAGVPLPGGYEDVTVSTSPVGLTPPDQADVALVQVQTAAVRVRVDGGDPTSTSGYRVPADTTLAVVGLANIRNFRAVRETVNDAVLSVHYFARPLSRQARAVELVEAMGPYGPGEPD